MRLVILAARNHRVGLVIHGEPELVPGWAFVILGLHGIDLGFELDEVSKRLRVDYIYLLQSGIGELQHIHHANNLATLVHDGQIEIVTI
jgi:hypothetical protein